MQPKLLRDSKTDVASDGHECCAARMRSIPVHADPQVHSGAHADIACDSCEQYVAAAPSLSDTGHAVILRMQPCEHRADKPLTRGIPRFVRRSEEHTSELQSRFDLVCRL